MRFLDHEEKGLPIARAIMERLRVSGAQMDTILWLIEHHLTIFKFCELRELKARALAQSPHFSDLLTLGLADAQAAQPVENADLAVGGNKTEKLFAAIRERYEHISTFLKDNAVLLDEVKRAVNGKEIMQVYQTVHGIPLRGRNVGLVKAAIEERISTEKVTEVSEAQKIMMEVIKDFVSS